MFNARHFCDLIYIHIQTNVNLCEELQSKAFSFLPWFVRMIFVMVMVSVCVTQENESHSLD